MRARQRIRKLGFLTARAPLDLVEQIDEAATAENVSLSAWIIRACEAALRKPPQPTERRQ